MPDRVERLRCDAAPRGQQIRGNEIVREQPVARGPAERFRVDGRPLREGGSRADRVNATQETAHPFERRAVLQLGRPAAAFGIDGEAESGERVQRPFVARERSHDRQLARRELGDERVLLVDLRVAPAAGPVELRNERWSVVAKDLVDAVFVAAERQQASITPIADAIERVEDDVGRKRAVRVRRRR